MAFNPQANYTDGATATCRRNVVPTFADREVSRGQRGGSDEHHPHIKSKAISVTVRGGP
jgi:hypothetical protein